MADRKCEINFTIEETSVTFGLQNQGINFGTDLNYVLGSGSYTALSDKPQINFHTLNSGNNTYEYLGVEPTITDITEQDIDNLLYGG